MNNKLKILFDDEETLQEFIIASKPVWGETLYSIKAPKDKLGVNYE
jgi:hypothetical protein